MPKHIERIQPQEMPPVEPGEPPISPNDPEIIPFEDPFENEPPYEVPEPGEGP